MEFLTTGDGLKLFLRRWPAEGEAHGTVQIVHGLGEHIGRYEALATRLNAAGWHVAGHDQRGHGHSEGPRGGIANRHSLLTDLSEVVRYVRGAGKHVLLGHSMGGLVAARYVAEGLMARPHRWSRDVDALVLSSPALAVRLRWPQRLMLAVLSRLAPQLRARNGLNPAWISRDPEVVQRYRDDPLVHNRLTPRLARFIVSEGVRVRKGATLWRTPTLLMWAGADRCVAPAGSAEFAATAPSSVLTAHEYALLSHEIFNEPERDEVITRLTDWLSRAALQS